MSISSFRHRYEEFEDTKEVIRIRNSKNRQRHGQKKKDKRTLADFSYTI